MPGVGRPHERLPQPLGHSFAKKLQLVEPFEENTSIIVNEYLKGALNQKKEVR